MVYETEATALVLGAAADFALMEWERMKLEGVEKKAIDAMYDAHLKFRADEKRLKRQIRASKK
jgi:hypothetical protein